MENLESRESAIRWYRHFMDMRIERLIAEYRSVLVSDDEEMYPSLDWAMAERAPKVREEIKGKYTEQDCPECDETLEDTPKEVPGLYCSECNELW